MAVGAPGVSQVSEGLLLELGFGIKETLKKPGRTLGKGEEGQSSW